MREHILKDYSDLEPCNLCKRSHGVVSFDCSACQRKNGLDTGTPLVRATP